MICDGVFTYTTKAAATADEAIVAATAKMRLVGYSIRENGAGASVTELCHGTDATTVVAMENLAQSASCFRWLGDAGIPVESGLFINRVSGNTVVTVITKVV